MAPKKDLKLRMLVAKQDEHLKFLQTVVELSERLHEAEPRQQFSGCLSAVERRSAEVRELADEICMTKLELDEECEPDFGIITTVDLMCAQIFTAARFLKKSDEEGSKEQQEGDHVANRKSPRLPKIDLPSFSGDICEWGGFYELFKNLIHENPSLVDSDKMYYLVGCLKGQAKGMSAGLTISGDNYTILWEALKNKYDDPRIIANLYLDQLIHFKPLTHESSTSLNYFLEHFHVNIQALKKLKIPNLEDFILSYLAFSKLPVETQKALENTKRGQTFITYDDIIEFLRSQQKICLRSKGTSNKTTVSQSLGFSPEKGKVCRTYVIQDRERVCFACKRRGHSGYQCSEFLKLSPHQRRSAAQTQNRCYNCLGPHHVQNCTSNYNCKVCHQRHHTLLHIENNKSADSEEGRDENAETVQISSLICHQTSLINQNKQRHLVLLSTVRVLVYDRLDRPQACRFLVDNGSQSNFMTLECCRRLHLRYQECSAEVRGIGSSETRVQGCLDFSFSPHFDSKKRFAVSAIVIRKIIDRLPAERIARRNVSFAEHLCLADPNFDSPAQVDGILGADVYAQIIRPNKVAGNKSSPVGLDTELGYMIVGSAPIENASAGNDKFTHALCAVTETALLPCVKKFWDLEDVPNVQPAENENSREEWFRSTYSRSDSGRYMVKLPFTDEPYKLGDSYENAVQKFLRLERKFEKDPHYHERYSAIIQDYLDQKHLSEIKGDEKPEFYIPHHGIFKSASISTPLRVVFDASCKTTTAYSLNDILDTGPKLQTDITRMFLRFRTWKVAFTADIKQMYRQILLDPEHRRFQKIVWRFTSNQPLRSFWLNTVTFGVRSSPYLALRVLHQLAEDESAEFPKAAVYVKEHMYVDDLVSGADSTPEACLIYRELNQMMLKGGFSLCKWATNDKEFQTGIPMENLYSQTVDFQKQNFKVLGILWDQTSDHFYFRSQLGQKTCTKRNVLGTIARCYDPLGLVAPVTLLGKLLIKSLWALKLDWDEVPPQDIVRQWENLYDEWPLLERIKIPRFVGTIPDNVDNTLVGFADACSTSYGGVIYLKTTNSHQEISTHLIYARAKVAPIKALTIPKLELCAAHLLAKMLNFVLESFKNRIPIHNRVALSDSTIVLSWLRKDCYKLGQFVVNRVEAIRTLIPESAWFYVGSKDNACDTLSRGLTPSQLWENTSWLNGPPWLKKRFDEWPIKDIQDIHLDKDQKENHIAVPAVVREENPLLKFIDRQSSYRKMLASMVYILRFGKRLPRAQFLSPRDFNVAESYLLDVIQRHYFHDEMNALKNQVCPPQLAELKPFVKDSLIRVGGRLELSNLNFDQRHPILLPKNGHFVDLLIDYVHQTNFHTGPQLTLALIRQKFWILSGRNTVRLRLKKCNLCFRFKPKNSIPIMGNLPAYRLGQAKPFLKTGVDYAGPVYIVPYRKRGVRSVKAYICVFVCMVTKAVHVELATDLSTQTFLQAFKRFISRRGTVSEIWSDNGTNFIGAKSELDSLYKLTISANHNACISRELAEIGVKWHLIPPQAPHMGGLWESQVKAIKNHLFKNIREQLLTYEEMSTVLAQIEALLNSRPLCVLGSDPRDPSVLTPSHFLTLGNLSSLHIPDVDNEKLSRLSRFQLLDQIVRQFWKRWHLEYLNTLQSRKKWKQETPPWTVGTVVLFEVPNTPPLKWPLGIIEKLHPGPDNVTRVVTIRTKNGDITRPVTKVYSLPTQ